MRQVPDHARKQIEPPKMTKPPGNADNTTHMQLLREQNYQLSSTPTRKCKCDNKTVSPTSATNAIPISRNQKNIRHPPAPPMQ